MKNNNNPIYLISLSLTLLLIFGSAGAIATPEQPHPDIAGDLFLGGTGTATGILKLLAAAYQREHPSVEITVYPSLGSGGGIRALAAGKLSVSFASRELTDNELAMGLIASDILRTPFIFATHPDTPIDNVTLQNVANLLAGETTHWVNGVLVRPVLRPLDDADSQIVMDLSPDIRRATLKAHSQTAKNVAPTDSDTANKLETIQGAFGTTTLILLKSEQRQINALSLDGIEPNLMNLQSGRYSLQKTVYAVSTPSSSPLTKSFLEFLSSPKASRLIHENGGIPGEDR